MKRLTKLALLFAIVLPYTATTSQQEPRPEEGHPSGETQKRLTELATSNPSDTSSPFGQIGSSYQLPNLPKQQGSAQEKGYWPLDRRTETDFLLDAIINGDYVATYKTQETTIGNTNTNVITALSRTLSQGAAARYVSCKKLDEQNRESLTKDTGPIHLLLLAMKKAADKKTTKIDPTALENLDHVLELQKKEISTLLRGKIDESFARFCLLMQLQREVRDVYCGAEKLLAIPDKDNKVAFLKPIVNPETKKE